MGYLVKSVNGHLDRFQGRADDERRRLEQQLEQVEAELANVQKAILAGLVAEMTAALLKDREAQKGALRKQLQNLANQVLNGPIHIDAGVIKAQIAKLDDVLSQDADAANAFFREHLKIRCTPTERDGRRFYRASGEANGSQIIKSLGLAQAFDFGGCGGWI